MRPKKKHTRCSMRCKKTGIEEQKKIGPLADFFSSINQKQVTRNFQVLITE
jgi:hypothetical protein